MNLYNGISQSGCNCSAAKPTFDNAFGPGEDIACDAVIFPLPDMCKALRLTQMFLVVDCYIYTYTPALTPPFTGAVKRLSLREWRGRELILLKRGDMARQMR
jgi:hypothetical protein